MSAPSLRPEPGRGRSGRSPFFSNASFAVEGAVLVVTDEKGVRHSFPIGARMRQVDHFGTVGNSGIRGEFGSPWRGINAWLVVVDSVGGVLVASDLEQWDQEEVHAWWCLLHGGQLSMYRTEPGATQDLYLHPVEGRTLLLGPVPAHGIWWQAGAWTLSVLFTLVPYFTELPVWAGLLPVAAVISWWVLGGAVRGRRQARRRADRMAALYAVIPPERLVDEPT